jgi:hypothetical protein
MERELWLQLYLIVVSLDKFSWRGRYRPAEIVGMFLWSVIHDRPVAWACQRANWPDPPRYFPSQGTMSRRLRSPTVQQLLDAVERHLGGTRNWWVQRIDSKPLPVGSHSKDPDAKWGYAGKSRARGYRLHAVWGPGQIPAGWRIESMNEGDAPTARKLICQLAGGGGYLVGDSQYDSNPLHAVAAEAGYQVVAPQQRPSKKLGHRRHHPARLRALALVGSDFGRALMKHRGEIERCFATLTCSATGLSPLPAWVRRLHRVRLWVQAKLLINAIRSKRPQHSLTANA